MPTLKMLEDRKLIVTKLGNIYQDENKAEILKIILPKKINNIELDECCIYLSFINQTGTGDVCDLTEYLSNYSDISYIIEVPMYRMFTCEPGAIEMWLKVLHSPTEMVAKTNEVSLSVGAHKEIEGTIPEQEMSIISKLVEKLEATTIKVDEVSGKVENIISGEEQIVQPMLIGMTYEIEE